MKWTDQELHFGHTLKYDHAKKCMEFVDRALDGLHALLPSGVVIEGPAVATLELAEPEMPGTSAELTTMISSSMSSSPAFNISAPIGSCLHGAAKDKGLELSKNQKRNKPASPERSPLHKRINTSAGFSSSRGKSPLPPPKAATSFGPSPLLRTKTPALKPNLVKGLSPGLADNHVHVYGPQDLSSSFHEDLSQSSPISTGEPTVAVRTTQDKKLHMPTQDRLSARVDARPPLREVRNHTPRTRQAKQLDLGDAFKSRALDPAMGPPKLQPAPIGPRILPSPDNDKPPGSPVYAGFMQSTASSRARQLGSPVARKNPNNTRATNAKGAEISLLSVKNSAVRGLVAPLKPGVKHGGSHVAKNTKLNDSAAAQLKRANSPIIKMAAQPNQLMGSTSGSSKSSADLIREDFNAGTRVASDAICGSVSRAKESGQPPRHLPSQTLRMKLVPQESTSQPTNRDESDHGPLRSTQVPTDAGHGSSESSAMVQLSARLVGHSAVIRSTEDPESRGPDSTGHLTVPDISASETSLVLQDWARTPEVAKLVRAQQNIDPLTIFGPIPPVDLDKMFPGRNIRPRGSSAEWSKDGVTSLERLEYASKRYGDTA